MILKETITYTCKFKRLYFILMIFLIIFLSFNVKAYDKISTLDWFENDGGSALDCFEDVIELDNGYIVAIGYSASTNNPEFENKGGNDAIMICYNSKGEKQWLKSFGGSATDVFLGGTKTSDGNFVVAGYSNSPNVGLSINGGADGIIAKYDKNGNQLWIKSYGGTNHEFFRGITELSNGDLVVAGEFLDGIDSVTNNGSYDAIVACFDKDGNYKWVNSFGGSLADSYYDITSTENAVIAVGYSISKNANYTNKGENDAIISAYNPDTGKELWVKNFGGSKDDYFASAIRTKDGNIIAVGYSVSANAGFEHKGGYDGVIVKYDEDGNQIWLSSFNGTGSDLLYEVSENDDGEIIVFGSTNSTDFEFEINGDADGLVVKFDSNGKQLLAKSFGGDLADTYLGGIATSDGGYIGVGYTSSTTNGINNLGSFDTLAVKYCERIDVESVIENTEETPQFMKIREARLLVNAMPESMEKDMLQARLNMLNPIDITIEPETASSNLDVFVSSNNSISLTILKSNITFEDFAGVDNEVMKDAISINVDSSLPYDVNVSLIGNIVSNKGNVLNKSILNLKDSSEADSSYSNYESSDTIKMYSKKPAGNNINHKIDMMLKGNIAHTADVYKAVLKISIEQV